MHRNKEQGFTLYELMVTLAVAGVILSFGVPGFMSFIDNSRATSDTNDLVTAMNLARSEATRRAADVTVCSSLDGATCNGGNDWSTGWVVLSGADLLRVWPERSGGANVLTGDADQVVFGPRGALSGGQVNFQIRLPDCTGDNGRDVSVNPAGRTAATRVAC